MFLVLASYVARGSDTPSTRNYFSSENFNFDIRYRLEPDILVVGPSIVRSTVDTGLEIRNTKAASNTEACQLQQ